SGTRSVDMESVKGGKPHPSRSPAGKPGEGTVPPRSNWLAFFVLLAVNYVIVSKFFPGPASPEPISYTVFRAELAKDNVEAIHTQGETIEGKFKAAVQWTPPVAEGQSATEAQIIENFTTILPLFVDPGLETELIDRGVDIRAKPIQPEGNPLLTLLSAFGPALLIIGIYVWLFRRATRQGGGMLGGFGGIGKSKARRFDKETETRVTFRVVAAIARPGTHPS